MDHDVARAALFEQWGSGAAPTTDQPVRLHFCAGGARAAFVITDHADRTRLPISTALYRGGPGAWPGSGDRTGLMDSGVKITQSAFRSGWPGYDYLDNPRFYRLMREIQEAGFEICPHNTSEDLALAPDQIRRNIDYYAEHFALDTWIDHSRLPSNLTQQGMKRESPYFILDRIQGAGCRAAWAYHDRYANPPDGQLDLLQPPATGRYLRQIASDVARIPRGRRHLINARSRIASVAVGLVGTQAFRHVNLLRKGPREVGLGQWLAVLWRAPEHAIRHAVAAPAPNFPVRWDGTRRLFWFDAARITFVTQCYTAEALGRLVADSGIHIGHTYLGHESRRHYDFAFTRHNGEYRIHDRFAEFLSVLHGRIRAGDVWNPTMRDMVGFYDDLATLELAREPDGQWCLRNRGARHLRGVTVRALAPWTVAGGGTTTERQIGAEWWYVLDLAPGHRVRFVDPTNRQTQGAGES